MPRRKITKAKTARLTLKQLKFCEGVLTGLSLSDAYRAAYDCAKMSSPAIWCEASKLRSDQKVALWLDAVLTEVKNAHICTREDHMQELARIKAISIRTGNLGAAAQCEQLRGKVAGHYVEQFADVSDSDPIATLNQLAEHDPKLAQNLATAYGITWAPVAKGKPPDATAH